MDQTTCDRSSVRVKVIVGAAVRGWRAAALGSCVQPSLNHMWHSTAKAKGSVTVAPPRLAVTRQRVQSPRPPLSLPDRSCAHRDGSMSRSSVYNRRAPVSPHTQHARGNKSLCQALRFQSTGVALACAATAAGRWQCLCHEHLHGPSLPLPDPPDELLHPPAPCTHALWDRATDALLPSAPGAAWVGKFAIMISKAHPNIIIHCFTLSQHHNLLLSD